MEFTRISNDTNGNPRYVTHFLNLVTDAEKEGKTTKDDEVRQSHPWPEVLDLYKLAVKRTNKIGGRKYHTKTYGGGIVFQSYNIKDTENRIKELLKTGK